MSVPVSGIKQSVSPTSVVVNCWTLLIEDLSV